MAPVRWRRPHIAIFATRRHGSTFLDVPPPIALGARQYNSKATQFAYLRLSRRFDQCYHADWLG
jgi:hypothetical protein